ncbi:aminoglycoside 6-adenylyltransferase [Bacillus sp. B-jedd]|uniref:aminoglycoside 6-adenylyltransferase n=1 Tax=Bacillus sp. B-jedd TaxID=1476857 RepID=UPI0005157039|nr:aminoglycoside 6-adenylyltransferase [Bacillus sp. B-jedd]CEG27180.1 hypothetical protein BN1002_02036 [Bacillus sp. B-jedd]
MVSFAERDHYFNRTIDKLQASNLVEGIIQLGSGVAGYKDVLSDIDLMISISSGEDSAKTKEVVLETLGDFNPVLIKEKNFYENVLLVIAILENKLEFNISIVPRELLIVKSPLWKVIVDKSGLVTEKMNVENERFLQNPLKYEVHFDVPFEFAYCAFGLEKELKRNNLIYALTLLQRMREYTLIVQAMNEEKKLHQFKAYETLDPAFIQAYLLTYPEFISVENLLKSGRKLKHLFEETISKSRTFSMNPNLNAVLNITLV